MANFFNYPQVAMSVYSSPPMVGSSSAISLGTSAPDVTQDYGTFSSECNTTCIEGGFGEAILLMGCPICEWSSTHSTLDNYFFMKCIYLGNENGICCTYNDYGLNSGSNTECLYWRFIFAERYYVSGSNYRNSGYSCYRICRATDRIYIPKINGVDTNFRDIPSGQMDNICKCWFLGVYWAAAAHPTTGGECMVQYNNIMAKVGTSNTNGYFYGWHPMRVGSTGGCLCSGANCHANNSNIRTYHLGCTFCANGRWDANGTKRLKWYISASGEGSIATEHGGSTPHALSEYYRGGGLVADTSANSSVPTSGTIKISDFYHTD
tara:strand:+ start:1929 stop:2891 length:963 start_codon:yes stop_codon:yes gene_type:complete